MRESNYETEDYFLPPSFSISKKIDVAAINGIHPHCKQQVIDFFKSNDFRKNEDFKPKNDRVYDRAIRFEKVGASNYATEVYFFHTIKENSVYGFLKLTIHDPDKKLLIMIDKFFREQHMVAKVTMVELAFDLFTDDVVGLYEWINNHLLLKYLKKPFDTDYATSTYTGNPRKTKTKAIRVYMRPIAGPKTYVRIELVLKKNVIRSKRIDVTLRNIDKLKLADYFDFRVLDERAIVKHLIWNNRKQIAGMERRRKGSGGLLRRMIKEGLIYGTFSKDTLMKKIKYLKSDVSQYHRFLLPLPEMTSLFMQNNKSYLPAGEV